MGQEAAAGWVIIMGKGTRTITAAILMAQTQLATSILYAGTTQNDEAGIMTPLLEVVEPGAAETIAGAVRKTIRWTPSMIKPRTKRYKS